VFREIVQNAISENVNIHKKKSCPLPTPKGAIQAVRASLLKNKKTENAFELKTKQKEKLGFQQEKISIIL